MLRRKIDQYLINWKNNSKSALLIKGACQVGKTTSIKNFIKNNYEIKTVIEINFAYNPELIDVFASFSNYEQLTIRLSSFMGDKLIKGKTIIFFDEIQLLYARRKELIKQGIISSTSLDIVSAMKPLVEEGDYRFILSGSLLGVELNDQLLTPTGYMEEITMFPLDFEEYLWAKGVGDISINYLKKCFEATEEVDSHTNDMMLKNFKEYVLIGGLPEAVKTFLKTKNLYLVNIEQEKIYKKYTADILKYVEDDEKRQRIKNMYDALASELNSKNKRFTLSHVFSKSQLNKDNSIVSEYLWLTYAGIAIPTFNVTEPKPPLSISSERKTFKLFANDVGLLASMLTTTGLREKLLLEEKEINYGAPYENAVAQELWSHGFFDKLYYFNSKKHGEIDFIVELDQEVIPIEIKSGKPQMMNMYNHSELNNIINNFDIKKAYIFGETNIIKENETITQFPIYMISFIQKN